MVRDGGATSVRIEKEGAKFGLVLVPDETELDVRAHAKQLSGNSG